MKAIGTNLMAIALFIGLSMAGCKKEKDVNSGNPGSGNQVAAIQDAESQDAIATKVEQDADKQADALESSNYNVSETKSTPSNGVTIAVDHPDTLYFPKVVTLTYNYADTVNGEYMMQTGTITITIDTIPVGKKLWWRKHLMRTFSFDNFSVTNDSCSFSVNGTRTMKRQDWKSTLSGDRTRLRIEMKDTIFSNISIDVTCGAFTGNFTRHVSRNRDNIVHYYKFLAAQRVWHPLLNDTITFRGTITGTNLQDSAYIRLISTPLMFTLCPVWPHNLIGSGVIEDTEGTRTTTITYTPDGCRTKVSAINENGKSISVTRKINRRFHKWW